MSDLLNRYLTHLHSLPSLDAPHCGLDASNTVVDLGSFCLENVSSSEQAYYSSLLFSGETSIVSFLRKVITLDEFQDAKIELLKFLQSYVMKMGKKINPYVVEIKDICLKIFSQDHSNKAKAETLPLMAEMTRKTKKPDMLIIAGCLRGLTSYLTNFTQSVSEGSKFAKDIYTYGRMAINPQVSLSRYEVPKAGLYLFAKHSAQFKEYIAKDYEVMYGDLYRWCKHHNKETSYAAYAAMEAFFQQISLYFVGRHGDKSDLAMFMYFIKTFRRIIDSVLSDTRQMAIAVRGYGYFSKPCKLFMQADDVRFMFSEIMQRSEQFYLSQSDLSEDRAQHLPTFLEALSSIIEELDKISDSVLACMERIVRVLFDKFAILNKGGKFLCCKALIRVLFHLSSKGAILRNFLSEIVYQGLIRTCSHPVILKEVNGESTIMEEREVYEGSTPNTSLKDYLELWEYLLDKDKLKDESLLGKQLEERKVMHGLVYDEMIRGILRIIHKLDLSSSKGSSAQEGDILGKSSASDVPASATADKEVSLSDPVPGLQPKVPKDFLIFISLIEFCRCVLPNYCVTLFERWIYMFCRDIIIMSSRFPVVSGFYKLLEVCMKMCEKLSFFKNIKAEKPDLKNENLNLEIVDTSDCMKCFVLFHKFTKEIVVRMQQYKDDLLFSCLLVVLSLPLELVTLDLVSSVAALKLTFKLGLSYTPLAEAGLDALESWTTALPADKLKPFLREILQCLDGYLTTLGDIQLHNECNTIVLITSSHHTSRGRKLPLKLLKMKPQSQHQMTLTPLAKVRHKILRMFGGLGGETNILLLDNTGINSSNAVVWDTENHLTFAVPFQDMKPSIYLDPFLPRVVELAAKSSDRQTKVAACECLHSLVHYMLGKSVTQPQGFKKSPMEHLWKHVFPTLLQLACDVEQVSEQLFKPLVFQLIHWFTNNRKYETPETMALLDAIVDGIVHPVDTSLRDFSAQCIKEFLQWSIKQSSEKQLEKSPINIKSLLKRLYSLALHPSASKRLGAALAFNNIYTVFREEASLVDIFVLEILVNYLECLCLSHGDEEARGTQEQCVQVIIHLERIIHSRAQLLVKENHRRRIPRGFASQSSITLIHMIPWLVKQCGRPSSECRHQCMRLISKLAPLLPGVNSAADWMKKTHEDHPSSFVHRFEGGGGGGQKGIEQYPTLAHIGGHFSLKETILWFEFVLAALDCYTWSFSEHLLSPSWVFTSSEDNEMPSVLLVSLKFFLSHLAMFGITEATSCFTSGPSRGMGDIFTPKEIDDYFRAKCTVIVRVLNFLTILLQDFPQETLKTLPPEFWSEDLFEVVLSCVLEPGVVGFHMGDVEVVEKLPEQTGVLCKLLVQRLSGECLERLKGTLEKKIALGSHCNLFDQLPFPLSNPQEHQVDCLRLAYLVQGYQQLHCAGLLLPALKAQARNASEEYAVKLFTAVYDGVKPSLNVGLQTVILDPASQHLASKLLDLAYDLGLQFNYLMESIMEDSNDNPGSSCGCTFYRIFQTSINGFFIERANIHMANILMKAASSPFLVLSLLNGILDQVIRDKILRTRNGSSFVAVLLNNWTSFEIFWRTHSAMDLRHSILMILKKMLILDPAKVTDCNRLTFPSLFEMYLLYLKDKSTTLAFKGQVLELLPYFTKSTEEYLRRLKEGLNAFVTNNIPLKSTEFVTGGPQYNDYVQTIDKLLAAFVNSRSLILLEVLIAIFCRERQHVHEDQIQQSFIAFIQRLHPEPDQAKAAMDVCLSIFFNERDYQTHSRRAVIERICITFLLKTSTTARRAFYQDQIQKLMSVLEAKELKPTDPNFESQVTSKLCCFKLVEILYSQFSKSELNTLESTINKAYVGGDVKTGKELTLAITKAARAASIEDMRGETVALELRRQFHCAAYNALVALICCTQTDLKFYVAFLFSENPIKGQLLLDNLVDCNRTYTFEVELSAPLERRKQFRMQARIPSPKENSLEESAGRTGLSIHYMYSQYLADSSLSEDISQCDFSSPIQVHSGTEARQPLYKLNESSSTAEQTDDWYEVSEDTLEMDDLNRHESMAKMISLLKHLVDKKISPEQVKDVPPTDMPAWMAPLHKKIASSSTHLNIRLFIAKLIINEAKIFEAHAKFWFNPLMELILQIKDTEPAGTEGINYFIVDLVVTLLSWSTTAIPEDSHNDRHLASRLLGFLMSRTRHRHRSLFRNNLEIVKSVVEIWKSILHVPAEVIFNSFSDPDPVKKDNAVGIQLLGVVVANGLFPVTSDSTIDEDRFYGTLVNNLTFKYKDVHAAAAEVIGLLMMQLAKVKKIFDGPLHDMVGQKLLSLVNRAKPELDKFITCVHKLKLNYPPIVDRFVNQILFTLPSVHGDFKSYCLEILCSRVEHIPNLFTELKGRGLKEMLSQRDDGIQIGVLRIIKHLMKKLTIPELKFIFPLLTSFVSHPNLLCRDLMYDIFIWIYDSYRADEAFQAEEGSADILADAKDHLLQGLADDHRDLQLKLRNFWSDEARLPGTTLERLVEVLRALYSTTTEIQYLSYTTNLILHLTSLSPDYERLMFEQPLSECRFEEYQIDYSWQKRHLAMTPLFAATQGSHGSGMTPTQESMSVDGSPGLRATQNLQFTPTQDQRRSTAFDWLNPTQESNLQPSQSFAMASTQTQSLLLFSTSQSHKRRKMLKPVPGDFGSQKLSQASSSRISSHQSQDPNEKKEILKLKRRFLKDQSQISAFFAKQALKRNKFREQALQRQKAAREGAIVMYRKYRSGDLPDIQIKYSELIAPLQALAQCDNTFAKQLFSALFRGIFSKIDEKLPEREAASVTSDLRSAMNHMLSSSTQFFPPFISSIQDICFHECKLRSVDSASVSTACLTSLQQPIGIMLLEKQLLEIEGKSQNSRKRAKTSTVPPSEVTTCWIELSKLYRSVGDYDVLRGIFTGHIGTKDITREAMEAEARGDYSQALKLYNEAIGTDDVWIKEELRQEEEDLWDVSRLQCLADLTKWKELEKCSVESIDDKNPPDLDKVWSDTFYQEHYLPHLITSKLKLQCQGSGDMTLNEFVAKAMKTSERAALLRSRYSDSLALMYVLQDNCDSASYYAALSEQSFLSDWAGLDSNLRSSRSIKLQSLQKITEMQEFLEFIAEEGNFSSPMPVLSLLNKWYSRLPHPILHPIGVWDDIVTNRVLFMSKFLQKFEAMGAEERSGICLDDIKDKFFKQEVELKLCMANAAKEQGNYAVAHRCLKEALYKIPQGNENLNISWSHTYAEVHFRKIQTLTAVGAVETALLVAGQLDKFSASKILEIEPLRGIQHHILRSKTFDILCKAMLDGGVVIATLESQAKNALVKLCRIDETESQKKVVSDLMTRSFVSLQSAIKAAKNAEGKCNTTQTSGTVDAMIAMVNFCDNCLRKKEVSVAPVEVDTKLFPGIVVRYMLKSMCYSSKEARQKFPRLLQIVHKYPDTLEAFVKKAADVPCWMFIGWINQMMAIIDKPEGKAVHGIVSEIAKRYPQALWYPFKISSEHFVFENSEDGKANEEAVKRLRSSLEHPLLDDFIAALEMLTNPEMVFRDWCEGPMKQLLEDQIKRNDSQAVKQCFGAMFQLLMDCRKRTKSGSQTRGTESGPFRTKFAQEFANEVQRIFGKEGEKLVGVKMTDFSKWCRDIQQKMVKFRNRTPPPGNLKEYSPWLSRFQSNNFTHTLEIPGQYKGKTKPLPEYHVKIVGFDEKVQVLPSIRKPKCLIIRGDDEKDHMFLVKGGEDLRLDQRIEQLFGLMNDIMANDSACSQRGLRLRTYQVIPMTPRVGLIEWMNNTKPLKGVLNSAMTKAENDHYIGPNGAGACYRNWIDKFKGDPRNPSRFYGEMFKKANRTETERSFTQKQALVPWDLLRRAFLQLAVSPEAFFILRSHFASSHACLCICQYILGIGDRHLSNFLVDMETGGMIGIDFGHAFGSATQFQPLPELMPFRLTQQFVNLMLPLKKSGTLQSVMIHTLRALRSNHDLLLNTMDVFIQEPSLDWQVYARKQAKTQGINEEEQKADWYPKQKVQSAWRKLEGFNPAYVMRDDLQLGHSKQSWYKQMESVCLGDRNANVRAREPESGLSVESQVSCLIDQATDANILGRTWQGWEPWV
ncbi:DNA-dependent protein kinase catalytic subunit-like isoform X5 [Stylophora pistillata]|uniref:DNA-dependent protein kinase catalytic subunit-like isoform X5 n=1 Tax=Stylophora pistillata TaxID=50429 RepID=UPI000C04E0CA|nr:DNA-dependent protein kinase catalytic subunit-like isoform X5 [Stylophora pistillata]